MITITSTSYTVDLANPTFSDTFSAAVRLFLRRTLSNKQRTTVSTSLEQVLNFTIAEITIQQKKDFEEVLSESDELITIIDYNGHHWEGYITNFPFDFVETFTRIRKEGCKDYMEGEGMDDTGDWERRYSCTINFRGIRI